MIIGIYGTWRALEGDPIYQLAYDYGRVMASAGHSVLTGGYSGVMEAASRGAVESGGETIGVTCPEIDKEMSRNKWITSPKNTPDLRDRLVKSLEVDVTVFFPGRLGTIAELSLAFELRQKGVLRFPVFFTSDFWDRVIQTFAQIDSELPYDRSKASSQSLSAHCNSPEELLKYLK